MAGLVSRGSTGINHMGAQGGIQEESREAAGLKGRLTVTA